MNTLRFKHLLKNIETGDLEITGEFDILNVPTNFKKYEIMESIQSINLKDINKQNIFQGDILKVNLKEGTSKIFDTMRKNGDTEIFLFVEKDKEFGINILKSHDERKYSIGHRFSNFHMFLLYLIQSEAIEIVGNTFIDTDFVKKIIKTEEMYEAELREKMEISIKEEEVNIVKQTIDIISNKYKQSFEIGEVYDIEYKYDKEYVKMFFKIPLKSNEENHLETLWISNEYENIETLLKETDICLDNLNIFRQRVDEDSENDSTIKITFTLDLKED